MSSVTIVVVDGLGIGAMPDAGELRAGDVEADTLGRIATWRRARGDDLRIPHLAALGLAELRPELTLAAGGTRGHAARSALGYPGADTFAGHQTMMGADMSHVVLARVADRIAELSAALESAGHGVERLGERPVLIVDGEALVHDNLEADPGLNWNVSARIDRMPWDRLLAVASVVRRVAPVARVISVGGVADGDLADFVRSGPQGTVGLDTPASGFYRNPGLMVQHLGIPIDHRRQLPDVAARAGVSVALIGKAADLLMTDAAVLRRPGVLTAGILSDVLAAAGRGLVVANVQQTDLAGHSQDTERWAALLEQVDDTIGRLVEQLGRDDLLIVTGDHGNDPGIGHNFHTREYVPVIAACGGGSPWATTEFASLADIGATAAAWLCLDPASLGNGTAAPLRNR